MSQAHSNGGGDNRGRVEETLKRCLTWARSGSHRRIIAEVSGILPDVGDDDRLRAALLTWKAQAHLALGDAEMALPPAALSWDLDPTPQACHLKSNALEALGDADQSEELLRVGWRLFPEAIHLPVQLAVTLSDQARIPEALDILEEIDLVDTLPDDLQVFLCGMRANFLASMGRWSEADDVLRSGLGDHPESTLLEETQEAVFQARRRSRIEEALVESWREGLTKLGGVGNEVDDAIRDCCAVNELSELYELAARRLWRAYLDYRETRPQSPEVWAAALVLKILEMDGERPTTAPFARSFGSNPSSVRSVLRRIRTYTGSLDPEFRIRAFAARSNPRLKDGQRTKLSGTPLAEIVQFPSMTGDLR